MIYWLLVWIGYRLTDSQCVLKYTSCCFAYSLREWRKQVASAVWHTDTSTILSHGQATMPSLQVWTDDWPGTKAQICRVRLESVFRRPQSYFIKLIEFTRSEPNVVADVIVQIGHVSLRRIIEHALCRRWRSYGRHWIDRHVSYGLAIAAYPDSNCTVC